MRQKGINLLLCALAFALFSTRVSSAQYGRYTTRVVPAASACATGNCPTGSVSVQTTQEKKDAPKETKAENETPTEETNAGKDSPEPNVAPPSISDLMEDVGVITLVYPSDAQSKDETVAYATRRAREPIEEDDDPLDSETPIGSIRTVGARLRELTAAVEEQRKQLDALANKDGTGGELFSSLRSRWEKDDTFQKDARDGLASLLEAVRKQNEGILSKQIQKAVVPEPSTFWKWGLIAAALLTIFIVWIILIVKLIGWCVKLGKTSVLKAAENTLSSLRSVKSESNASDELRL